MKDVDQVIERVTGELPNVQWHQLQVTHRADDDGVWFFHLPGARNSVQIESSTGMCPFMVESDLTTECYHGHTVVEVMRKVVEWLKL